MRNRIVASTILGFALLVGTVSAQVLPRVNHVTFKQTMALPGVLLPPGTYSFEIASAATNVVRVSSRDTGRHVFLGMTLPVDRPAGLRGARVRLGEAPAGQPTPIRVWYPADSRNGYQFLY